MASFTDAELSNLSLKSDDLPRLSNEDDEALLEAAIDVALGTHDPPADFAPAQFGVSPDLFHSPEASPLRACYERLLHFEETRRVTFEWILRTRSNARGHL